MVDIIRINGEIAFRREVAEILEAPLFSYDEETERMTLVELIGKFVKTLALPVTILGSGLNVTTPMAHAAVAVMADPQVQAVAAAAGKVSLWGKFLPLVHMVQEFAMPVGVVVATWGLIEIIMGNLGSGKEKVKYSLIGYIGVFVIPMVFEAIASAFKG